eukprot:SAG31_NODE_12335_length_949_cov_1.154118_1_plen_197_part_00
MSLRTGQTHRQPCDLVAKKKNPSCVGTDLHTSRILLICAVSACALFSVGLCCPSADIGPDTLGLVAAMVAPQGPLTSPTCPESTGGLSAVQPSRTLKVLDLCCGCGVQSICIAVCRDDRGVGKTSLTLVDRSPRAVRFSRFNAALNGVAISTSATVATTHATVLCGDASDVESLLPTTSLPHDYDVLLMNPRKNHY